MVANSSSRAQQHTYMEMYLHTFWAVHSPLSPQHFTELVIIFKLAGAFPSLSQTFHRTCLHFPISLWTRTSNLHQCAKLKQQKPQTTEIFTVMGTIFGRITCA